MLIFNWIRKPSNHNNLYYPSIKAFESPFFHHLDKGCAIIYIGYNQCADKTRGHRKCRRCYSVTAGKCRTHQVKVCMGSENRTGCGWQFGHHYDY